MGRALVVWLLVFATGLPGCAMRRDAGVVPAPEAASAVQARLDAYPSGTRVRLGLAGGERVEGVPMWVDAEAVSLETASGAAPRVIARTAIVEASAASTAGNRVRTASSRVVIGTLAVVATAIGVMWIAHIVYCSVKGDCM